MKIFLKILAIIMITFVGAGITCGGNLLLSSTGDFGSYGDKLFPAWFIEIGVIFLGSLYFIFWKYEGLRLRQKKWGKYLFIFMSILIIGILGFDLFGLFI